MTSVENSRHSKNIIGIDILRALAALGVFFYHSHVGDIIAKYSGLLFFRKMDAFGATYAVPLFFLISGYCIHSSNLRYIKAGEKLPLKRYYIKRLLRIYPPYLFALLVALLINVFLMGDHMPPAADLIIHLFALQGFSVMYFNTINVVLWTISIEIAFYFIYPMFYFLCRKYSLDKALICIFLVSLLSIVFFQSKTDLTSPERFCVFNLWFGWCCGAYLAEKIQLSSNGLKESKYRIAYLFIVIGFVLLNFIPNNLPVILDQFNILIWAAPLVWMIRKESWLYDHRNVWPLRVIAAIGLSSYSLYLLHEPLLLLKNTLAHKFVPANMLFLGLAIGLVLIPVACWYSYKLIERPFTSQKKIGQR
jgi:peptidoglycan/LPS O-acetylase OafA/YrhL